MELCHGGGCGCKVSPGVLSGLLRNKTAAKAKGYERLLVGNSTSDDCAAWQVSDDIVMVGTADFFMPVVDDPHDFGRISATNALSDVYAMGAEPAFALALVGMPLEKISEDSIAAILEGGERACAEVGVPIAGGHTIDTAEPIYGLSVSGVCSPDELCRNDTAHDGDLLLLSKPLGIGILCAALRKDLLEAEGMEALLDTTTKPNKPGRELAVKGLANAMTDVTGFGVLGHVLEVCRGSGLSARLRWEDLPFIEVAMELARSGTSTGASGRNWKSYGDEVSVQGTTSWQQDMLTDPQTSGGLLVACAPDNAGQALSVLHDAGFNQACVIGELGPETEGAARVEMII